LVVVRPQASEEKERPQRCGQAKEVNVMLWFHQKNIL
jgi:hypothetical protein